MYLINPYLFRIYVLFLFLFLFTTLQNKNIVLVFYVFFFLHHFRIRILYLSLQRLSQNKNIVLEKILSVYQGTFTLEEYDKPNCFGERLTICVPFYISLLYFGNAIATNQLQQKWYVPTIFTTNFKCQVVIVGLKK